MKLPDRSTLTALALFSLWITSKMPFHIQESGWVEVLLVLNVLVLARPAIQLHWNRAVTAWWNFAFLASALAFAIAYTLPAGRSTALLVVPWLCLSIGHSIRQCRQSTWAPDTVLQLAAYSFWTIGAAWALFDRLGWQPLGFSPIIVLLTAAHFHFAGLLLPLLSAELLRTGAVQREKTLVLGLLIGIPLVAVGITSTKLGGPMLIESIAATFMAGIGGWIGWLHLRQISYLLKLGGLLLMGGMLLAVAYGWNVFLGWSWLTIPWMYAVHGSLNAIALGLCLLPGWILRKRKV